MRACPRLPRGDMPLRRVPSRALILWVSATNISKINILNFLDLIYPHPPNRPYPDLTSTQGKGAWPATDAAAGGDRAGSSVGGPSGPNLASLEPVGPGTQKRRGARAD